MILKVLVLLASIGQVVAAVYLSIGTFEQTERVLPVFIQPAGWAFSIWGLIYTLSIVFAIYQIIPKYDNKVLRQTRLPALLGFSGSALWLYFAGMENGMVWLTILVLFAMAIVLTKVVTAAEGKDVWQNRLSKYVLLPYAAWTGIAVWVNAQALLVDQAVVVKENINIVTNLILFVGLALFTMYYYKKSGYSLWYGGVMIWASVAILIVNLQAGSILFATLAGVYVLVTANLYRRKVLR